MFVMHRSDRYDEIRWNRTARSDSDNEYFEFRRTIVVTKYLPIIWVAMSLSVTLSKPRHPLMDRWTLVILLTIASAVHFEFRKFAFVILGFGAILITTEFDTIETGAFTDTLRKVALARYPQPREYRSNDFVDVQDRDLWLETIDSEVKFFRFTLTIVVLFALLSIGDRSIRRSRIAKKQGPDETGP